MSNERAWIAGLVAAAELLLALPAAYFAVFSFMLFPTPEAERELSNWLLFGITWTVPLSLLAGALCALVALGRPRRRPWLVAALALPAAATLLFLGSIAAA